MYAFIAPIITLLYVAINNYLLQHIEILLHSVIFIYGMYIANIPDILQRSAPSTSYLQTKEITSETEREINRFGPDAFPVPGIFSLC